MANGIIQIYKTLCQRDTQTITSETIFNYLSALYELDFDVDVDIQVLEKTLITLVDVIQNRPDLQTVSITTQLCLTIENLIDQPRFLLTDSNNIIFYLNQQLSNPTICETLLNAIETLIINAVTPITPELSSCLLDPNGYFQQLASRSEFRSQIYKISTKIVECSNSQNTVISVLMSQETSCEVTLYALKSLYRIVDEAKIGLSNVEIRKILSVVWRFMCFDSAKVKDNPPLEIYPAEIALSLLSPNGKNKFVPEKKLEFHRSFESLMNNAELPPSGDEHWDNSRTVQSCIRHAAICLLIATVKCVEPQIIFQYWSHLIYPGSPSLRHCVRNDSSWCVRIVALIALEELLERSQQFLLFAEVPRTAITSFTSLSETLGASLLKLHDDLILLLGNSSVPVVKQGLRCLATLISATPYQRLSNTLLTNVLQAVQKLVSTTSNTDMTMKLEVLLVLQAVFKSTVTSNEIFKDDVDWIFLIIYEIVLMSSEPDSSTPAPVVVKCLQLLGILGKECLKFMEPKLDEIQVILERTLDCHSNCTDICLQSAKTVEILSIAFVENYENTEGENLISKERQFAFWNHLMPGIIKLMPCVSDSNLHTMGCDCIGSIPADIFQMIDRPKQIVIFTLLFSCTVDESCAARGASIRALTRGILEASRRDDIGLIADIAQSTLQLINDSYVFVRTKAAWALSNLTFALLENRNEGVTEDLDDVLYVQLLEGAIKANKDNDKVKCNVIRGLGTLLRLSTPELLENNSYKNSVLSGIRDLVKNLTTGRVMKIKWNTCYALGSMLKNEHIYGLMKEWDSFVYSALIKLITDCSNFKVRINASVALSSPVKREQYSSFWLPIWSSSVQVLDTSQNIEDFKEYKHRDILVEQVCLTLAHLISVANLEDLMSAYENIFNNMDMFKNHITKCQEQVLPEKATVFASAVLTLSNLLKLELNSKQKKIVDTFINIFNNDEITLY